MNTQQVIGGLKSRAAPADDHVPGSDCPLTGYSETGNETPRTLKATADSIRGRLLATWEERPRQNTTLTDEPSQPVALRSDHGRKGRLKNGLSRYPQPFCG